MAMAMAIGFNEDVTIEILLRLPVKSILRFKTVSKQWLSIVFCRRFRQIHASRNLPATAFFFYRQNHGLEFIPLEKLDNQISPNIIPFSDYPIDITSSSSGLLLLRSKSTAWQPFKFRWPLYQLMCDRAYFVCNPTTNEYKPLAIPQHIRNSQYVCETLAFDPSKSPHYKVVFLCKYYDMGKEFHIEIYSSETATFSSPATNSFTSHIDMSAVCGIYCNDAIHWISYLKSSFYYFDLNRECMNESPLPLPLVRSMTYFGESRGHLHLVGVDSSCPRAISLLDVYELKRDYSGWSLKYRVDLDSIAIAYPQKINSNDPYNVLSILVDEEEDLTMVLLVSGMFVACNFKKKLCTVLSHDDRLRMSGRLTISGWPISHQYIETLACV